VVPLVLPSPIALEVDFVHTHMADMAELVPGSTRPAGRTVRYVHDDYREVFRAFRAFTNLSSVRD
jgi:D-aminopeptidase